MSLYSIISSSVYNFYIHLPFPCSCAIYNGTMCTSVFDHANITIPSGDSIDSVDDKIRNTTSMFTAYGQGEACMAYLDFIACIATVVPCDGFAWCGSMSEVELNSTITRVCVHKGSSNTSNEMNNLSSIILNKLTHYHKGSSTTGRVGNNNLICQDVTVGKTCTCI